jgi:YVTN family beta-propeller protein
MRPQRTLLALALAAFCLAATPAHGQDYGYVGCSTTDNCIPFDLITYVPGAPIDLLPEGDYPYDATMTPDGTEVWIAGNSGDGVVVIDTGTNTITHRATVGDKPNSIVFTDDSSLALVSTRDGDYVYIIDTSTYAVIDSLDVTTGSGGIYDGPGNMALDPVSRNIYALDWYDDHIYEIAPDASSVLRTAVVGIDLWQLVVDPLGRYVYATDRGTDEVRVIDLATLAEIRTVAVGEDPWGIDVTLDATKVVVACEDDGSVHVIDTNDWSTTVIPLEAGADPRDVDILDDLDYAYVAGGQATGVGTRVYVIELATVGLKDAFTPTGGGNANVIAVQPQVTSDVTAVAAGPVAAPRANLRCYPNPFNPTLSVAYDLPRSSVVELAVYDAAGRRVAILDCGERVAGEHRATWSGVDSRDREAAAGVYFVRLKSGGESITEKAVLLK